MEFGIVNTTNSMKKNVDYILFVLTLAFTSFEFFFREELLFWMLSFVMGISFLLNRKKIKEISVYIIFVTFIIVFIFQYLYHDRYEITSVISSCIVLFGTFFIAYYVRERFVKIFVNVIFYISVFSLFFYLLSCIPAIRSFFIYEITPYFESLNSRDAIVEGGGVNMLIYNFQVSDLPEGTNFMRNCGPFWEPGMFAVYISIALFFNLFVYPFRGVKGNIILIISLITTFSTGGYLCGIFVLFIYILNNKKGASKLVGVICFMVVFFFVMKLDFVGLKISEQLDSAEIGSGRTRFGAFISQIALIKSSPLIGGADFSEILQGENKTLASGTLQVFILYGIPAGVIFYIFYFKSIKNILKRYNLNYFCVYSFFIMLLILSFSQTIFAQKMFMVMLFVGLMTQKKIQYETI